MNASKFVAHLSYVKCPRNRGNSKVGSKTSVAETKLSFEVDASNVIGFNCVGKRVGVNRDAQSIASGANEAVTATSVSLITRTRGQRVHVYANNTGSRRTVRESSLHRGQSTENCWTHM